MATVPSTPPVAGETLEQRLLVLAPVGRDGELTVRALGEAGISARACATVSDLCREINIGAAAILLTSEALEQANIERLSRLLSDQPAWSDLPVLLLAGDAGRSELQIMLTPLGNVTVLERPLQLSSLLSAVRTALRARFRQYQVRELLAQTEQGRAEAERQQSEIEALNVRLQRAMTETHHRVKNNLQIVAALIDMQIVDESPTIPVDAMIRLRMHVRMLASVHALLTEKSKEDGEATDISAQSLLEQLLPLMQMTAPQCRFEYTVEDTKISAKQGASLSIVANELVSNAVKYGRGQVTVRFRPVGDHAVLEVCDNGVGFPAAFDPLTAANTGLELIENLVQWDLHGSVAYTNLETGGCVTVTVPLSIPDPPSSGH